MRSKKKIILLIVGIVVATLCLTIVWAWTNMAPTKAEIELDTGLTRGATVSVHWKS